MAALGNWRVCAEKFIAVGVAAAMLASCGGGGDGPVAPGVKPVATVAVSLALSSVKVGNTTQASAVVRDADGLALTGRTISWSSSATNVATVSQSGLVTAVAVGTANIIATSETKTGSAALTVVVDPASTANVDITAIRQNGVAADLNKVAGVISIEMSEVVPQGFNGTVTVMIDTVLVSRTTYPAANLAVERAESTNGSGGVTAATTSAHGMSRVNVDYNTAIPIVTITGDEIAARGKLPNVEHVLRAVMAGTVDGTAVNKSDQVNFTTANVSGPLVGAGRWKNERVLLIDGRRYVTGETFTTSFAQVNYNAVPLSAIERVEILTGDASAVYGSDAVAGVVNVITGNKREFTTSEFACESGMLGTKLQATGIVVGGVTRDPRTNPFALNGVTFDADRNGFLDLSPAPTGYNFGAGITSQVYIPNITTGWPQGWFPLDGNFYCDNRGPSIQLGAFSAKGRNTTAYAPLDLSGGYLLPLNNTLAPNFSMTRWLDLSKVSDKGTGLRVNIPYKFYMGSGTTAELVNVPANEVGSSLPLGSNYALRGGVTFFDMFDNPSPTLATTTAENPIGLAGTPTSAGQIASFRVMNDVGSTLNQGVADRFWSINSSYNPFYQVSTDGLVANGEQYLTGSLRYNGSCAIGATVNCNPVQLPSIRTGVFASVQLGTLRTQAGINLEGYYDFNYTGYSSTGKPFTEAPVRIRGYYDFTQPSVPISATNAFTSPFTAGAVIPFTMTANDNLHVAQVGVQLRFDNFGSSAFERNVVEVPYVFSPFWNIHTARMPTWTGTYSSAIPTRVALAQPGTGLVSAPYYDLTDYSMFSLDAVDRRSNLLDFEIQPQYLPAPKTFNNLRVSIQSNSSTACLGRTESSSPCNPAAYRKILVTGVALSPVADDQGISQMHVYAINSAKQVVRLCRTLTALSTTTVGQDLRQEFQCEADMDDYKGPVGQLTVFAWFISSLHWIAAKTQFLFWSTVLGSRGSGTAQ